ERVKENPIMKPQKNADKKVTKELRNNQDDAVKHAQDIIGIVREPFLVLDGKLNVVNANDAFYKMYKVSKKDTEGTLVYRLGNQQWDIPELRKILEEVLPKKERLTDLEVTHDFPDIGKKTMLLNARKIAGIELILLSLEDITTQRRVEEARERSEKRFRAMIEKSDDAIALVDAKGKVLYASPSTVKVLGYTPEELQKLNNPFELVPPDERKPVTTLFEQVLKKRGSSGHTTHRIKHKGGSFIWLESVMTNLLFDPNVYAVVINYRDINKRRELEIQKDEFIGIASHELKTPVTSIKGYTQVLQNRFQKDGNIKAVELLSRMDGQINKLTSLIADLLDSTKIEGGKLQFHEGYFDFNELTTDIIEEMQLTSLKHTLIKKLATTKTISGDRDRIGQVITNLLSNAIKYSPHSNKIIVTTSEDKGNITLCVQDFGVGVPKEKQDKVFDRFFRVGGKKRDSFAGLGLGLYIAAEIIKRHNGRIWVESDGKKGTTFCFSLPIKKGLRKKHTNTLVEEELKHE
ncbi:MAG: PAS domain-containing sensor histidine kinase, partial [Candidatus Levyibacteriota bacterium]